MQHATSFGQRCDEIKVFLFVKHCRRSDVRSDGRTLGRTVGHLGKPEGRTASQSKRVLNLSIGRPACRGPWLPDGGIC